MIRSFLVFLMGLSLVGWACPSAPHSSPAAAEKDNSLSAIPLDQLAVEFRRLRKMRGHFDGGPWNDDVDRWMGRKHRVMLELASRLSGGQYDKAEISCLLGPADQIVRKGDTLFGLITGLPGYDPSTAGLQSFLVYYWRGTHDFLFFLCRDNLIVGSDWWYAGE
jgi:hypothetical protein